MVAPSAPSSPRARSPGERVAESLPCVSAVAGRARRVPRMRRRQIPAVLAYRIRPPKRLGLAHSARPREFRLGKLAGILLPSRAAVETRRTAHRPLRQTPPRRESERTRRPAPARWDPRARSGGLHLRMQLRKTCRTLDDPGQSSWALYPKTPERTSTSANGIAVDLRTPPIQPGSCTSRALRMSPPARTA